MLRVISDEDGTLNPAEDPFDGEIRTLGSDLDVNQAMQQIFNDFSKRPSFAKIDTEKYRDVVKIIKGKVGTFYGEINPLFQTVGAFRPHFDSLLPSYTRASVHY